MSALRSRLEEAALEFYEEKKPTMAISATTGTSQAALTTLQPEVDVTQGTDAAATSQGAGTKGSGFDDAKQTLVVLSTDTSVTTASTTGAETFRISASGAGLVAASNANAESPKSGAELAYDTLQFSEARLDSKEYQKLTWTFDGAPEQKLAQDVKADALAYIEKTPGLATECAQMINAAGAHPAKVDGLKVDFALNHFKNEGVAGTWGKTEAQVQKVLDEPVKQSVLIKDTEGKSGVSIAAPVFGSTRAFFNVDGSNNKIDFCSNPYPRPSGTADAVLGGKNNSGQLDLIGDSTIIVKAGEGNKWSVKDPAARIGTSVSELTTLMKGELAENAKDCKLVLEGSATDWTKTTSGSTATFVNTKTKTSAEIPTSAQGQVSYLETSKLSTLAADLKAGKGASAKDPTTKTTETGKTTTVSSTSQAWLTPEIKAAIVGVKDAAARQSEILASGRELTKAEFDSLKATYDEYGKAFKQIPQGVIDTATARAEADLKALQSPIFQARAKELDGTIGLRNEKFMTSLGEIAAGQPWVTEAMTKAYTDKIAATALVASARESGRALTAAETASIGAVENAWGKAYAAVPKAVIDAATKTADSLQANLSAPINAKYQKQLDALIEVRNQKFFAYLLDPASSASTKTADKTSTTGKADTTAKTSTSSRPDTADGTKHTASRSTTDSNRGAGATATSGTQASATAEKPATTLETLFGSMPPALAKKMLTLLLAKLGVTAKGGDVKALMEQLTAALKKPGAPSMKELGGMLRDEVKKTMEAAQKASTTKDPIDWYFGETGRNRQTETARWTAEGKSAPRVREELGSWQKKVTSKLVEDSLSLAYVAIGLEQAEATPGGVDASAHLDSIKTTPAGADGQWTRPLVSLPLTQAASVAATPTASATVTPSGTASGVSGRDASLKRISDRAIALGISQQSYNQIMQSAAGELNHRTTVDTVGNDPHLPAGYSYPTPEIDARLDDIELAEKRWGAKAGAETST